MGQQDQTFEILNKLEHVLSPLLEASEYATDTGRDFWDFAISIRQLIRLGASETDMRWLVCKGMVEQRIEVTTEGDVAREFRPAGNLTFSRRTCFVLTRTGIIAAHSHSELARCPFKCSSNHGNAEIGSRVPCWDANSRKLLLDDRLVKRFKWPAANQEAVLCAFEEERWPDRIDDPLPPQPEQDPKRRLADTIKCLNRKQVSELIHFRGDGSGEGVTWERTNHYKAMQKV